MKRRFAVRTAIASFATMLALVAFAPTANAVACGGCFCAAGSGTSGGYACVSLGGYNRWLKIA